MTDKDFLGMGTGIGGQCGKRDQGWSERVPCLVTFPNWDIPNIPIIGM